MLKYRFIERKKKILVFVAGKLENMSAVSQK